MAKMAPRKKRYVSKVQASDPLSTTTFVSNINPVVKIWINNMKMAGHDSFTFVEPPITVAGRTWWRIGEWR